MAPHLCGMSKQAEKKTYAGSTFGGFIGLEHLLDCANAPHAADELLTSGRSCLAVVLKHLPHIRTVHVPFYTCNSLLEPIQNVGLEIQFYGIDNTLYPVDLVMPNESDLLILTDLFGVLGQGMTEIGSRINGSVVYDDTHAFYFGRRSSNQWSFNSARKFCGVPDGAYLFSPLLIERPSKRNDEVSGEHLLLKFLDASEYAYRAYQRNEARMTTNALRCSMTSELMLERLDHQVNKRRRRENFVWLHEQLNFENEIRIDLDDGTVPFCYPFLPLERPVIDRDRLFERGLFLPTLWNDVVVRADPSGKFTFEKDLARRLLALPVDQRYDLDDMAVMLERLRAVLG